MIFSIFENFKNMCQLLTKKSIVIRYEQNTSSVLKIRGNTPFASQSHLTSSNCGQKFKKKLPTNFLIVHNNISNILIPTVFSSPPNDPDTSLAWIFGFHSGLEKLGHKVTGQIFCRDFPLDRFRHKGRPHSLFSLLAPIKAFIHWLDLYTPCILQLTVFTAVISY